MSLYRLKISDGTTTINLYDGGDAKVREGGLRMPPPDLRSSFISNPVADGERLASSVYSNRQIAIILKIWGSSLSDLKTNIRSIERLLADARNRTLLGYGSQVYLEYQWGDTDGQSIYFDILQGGLTLPANFLSAVLTQSYLVLDASLELTCKPFGRYTNQDIAQDTLENSQSVRDASISYLAGDDTDGTLTWGDNWKAQTFTTTGAFTTIGAAAKIYRLNTAGTVTMAIYATDSGLPTGAALASGTYDASAWSANGTYIGYIYVAFGTPLALSGATKYALVVSMAGGNAGNGIYWRYDNADGAHANGNRATSIDAGVNWVADANSDALFAIFAAETMANYQDVTTSEGYGDVPARMYIKLAQSGATGTTKLWIAKRSGTRQTDDLWSEAEDETSLTNIIGGAHTQVNVNQADTAVSNGRYKQVVVVPIGGNITANSELARSNYDIASPPGGQFRVLARARVVCQDVADYDHLSFGYGYSYGTKTKAPAEAASEYYQCAAHNTWEILDLGLVNIPPIAESDIADNSTFQLRLYLYATDTLTQNEYYKFETDWFFFLPADEGVVIIDSIVSTDTLAVDGITDPPNIFKTSSDLITDYPDYVGYPFELGRESTRIYVLRNDVKGMAFASDIKYQPRFLLI